MAFFPDVSPGEIFKPNALLSNNVRHLINALNGFGGKPLAATGGMIRIQVYNNSGSTISAGTAVNFSDSGSLCDNAVPAEPLTDPAKPWGVLVNQLESKGIGSCIICGPATVKVSGTGDYAAPTKSSPSTFKECVITGVTGKRGYSVINIEADKMNSTIGFVRRVLEIFEENEVPFEHLPSGIDTISIVLSTDLFEPCRDKILNTINRRIQPDSLSVEDGLALIAVVGRGMVKVKGTAARVFNAVSEAGINIKMIDQGSSEINIILGVEDRDFESTLKAIYNEFAG